MFDETLQLCETWNQKSLWIGFLSCFGISIVANFQETNVRIVHYIGALFCFGFGTTYFWIQSMISFYILPFHGTLFKARLRILFSIICTILFFLVAVTGIISHILYIGQNPRKW